MNTEVMFSSRTDMWETPAAFFRALDAEFHFTLDVCAVPENAKCKVFYTPEQDGLAQNWGGVLLVQSSVWQGDRQMGKKGGRGRVHSGHAATSQNRHGMVPRLHLREIRNPLCAGAAEIRRQQELCTVSIYGCNLQEVGYGRCKSQ